jgi:hypothetical protein
MKRCKGRAQGLLVFMIAVIAAIELGTSQARAQYGMGYGMFMGFNPVPSPTDFINQHALSKAANRSPAPSRNVYANNSNSYINRIRDNGLTSHYSADSRRPIDYVYARRARNARLAANNQQQSATDIPPVVRMAIPIGSFFDATRKLVWPSDAPVTGDLGPKRDTSDQASLMVMELAEKHGAAPITTVTNARQKLIDYGQPALQLLRSVTTPQIADSFHVFMLSLYESLAAAANPAEITSTANPAR